VKLSQLIQAATLQVKPWSGTMWHQTSTGAAQAILQHGFRATPGGNQRFTVGVYLLGHGEGHYGDVTLEVKVNGRWLDLTHDRLGTEWSDLKAEHWTGTWEGLTKALQKTYPRAQGIRFDGVLVVWDLSTIKQVKESR